jgi:hypothetical protein
MKTQTFTGMGSNFQVHDAFATESQGPVQNRTEENLVSSDKAIVAARKLILNGIKDVQQGREPQHVVRDAKANAFSNLVVISDVIAKSMDWKEYTRSRELK